MCINKQQTLIIGGKQHDIDDCLVPIVDALNKGGVTTVACCCGHGNRWGNVILADGRELIIAPDFESARAFDKIHGRPIHDERRALLNSELAATDSQHTQPAIELSLDDAESVLRSFKELNPTVWPVVLQRLQEKSQQQASA